MPPVFCRDPASEYLLRYDLASLGADAPESVATQRSVQCFYRLISVDLAEAWKFLRRFCSAINAAAEHKRQLPKETLLHAMAAVMYRLLDLRFCHGSIDEAVRLGLLLFSSHIFLNFRDIKPPRTYLSDTYRDCVLHIEPPGRLSPLILLWLLLVGSLSTFTAADDVWLMPWMRINIELCQASHWSELRGMLKTCPWIDALHDAPGRNMFYAH